MVRHVAVANERAHADVPVWKRFDLGEWHRADVDDTLRALDVQLHEVDEGRAAR